MVPMFNCLCVCLPHYCYQILRARNVHKILLFKTFRHTSVQLASSHYRNSRRSNSGPITLDPCLKLCCFGLLCLSEKGAGKVGGKSLNLMF